MIKKAILQDLAVLNDLNTEVQELHHKLYPKIFKPAASVDATLYFKDCLERDVLTILIKYLGEKPAGYLVYQEKNYQETIFSFQRKSLYIHHISVKKEYQSNGVGKILMQRVVAIAKESNIDCIELDVWTKNQEANTFFKKNGFDSYNEKCWLHL
jgi:ribosomal protein S18 acetylase RimI-like enzyme